MADACAAPHSAKPCLLPCDQNGLCRLLGWCCRPYEREVAFSIGRHYLTNETLPEELYQKIIATRNYRYANPGQNGESRGLHRLSVGSLEACAGVDFMMCVQVRDECSAAAVFCHAGLDSACAILPPPRSVRGGDSTVQGCCQQGERAATHSGRQVLQPGGVHVPACFPCMMPFCLATQILSASMHVCNASKQVW